MQLKEIGKLFYQTIDEWSNDSAQAHAAALAYYTIFSLAPILIVAIAVAGLVFGKATAQGEIVEQIRGLIGQDGARVVQRLIAAANRPDKNWLAASAGIFMLLFGATIAFGQLQNALNTIWKIPPKDINVVKSFLRDRLFSLAMVICTGFLLLVSLTVSTVLTLINRYFSELLPGAKIIWSVSNFFISFAVITLLFAMIFKFVPDRKIAWTDVLPAAILTAFLFNIGKSLIGYYLGNSTVSSTYGAAGSLVVVLIWVYYSAQILFLGAEFSQVYAKNYGSMRQLPENDAAHDNDKRLSS